MTTDQWFWCMNWCKSHGLAPAKVKVWDKAIEEYRKYKKKQD